MISCLYFSNAVDDAKQRLADARRERDDAKKALEKAETRREKLEIKRDSDDSSFRQQDLDDASSEFKSAADFYQKCVLHVHSCKLMLTRYRLRCAFWMLIRLLYVCSGKFTCCRRIDFRCWLVYKF